MGQNSANTKTTAEKEQVAVNNGDHTSAHPHLNLLEIGMQYSVDLVRGGTDAMLKPIAGAKSLVSVGQVETSTVTNETKPPESTAYKAGAMIGQAIDFGIVQTLSHKVPFIKAFGRTGASMTTGFAMGFLTGPGHDSEHKSAITIKSRFVAGLEGATTIGIMEGGSKGLSRLGISDTLRGRLIKSTASGALAGALTTQIDSKISTGHFASLKDTAIAAATWGLTGAAFTSAPSLVSGIKGKFKPIGASALKSSEIAAMQEPILEPVVAPQAPHAVINLDNEYHGEPSSTLKIEPKRSLPARPLTEESHDLTDAPAKTVDLNLQAKIAENHSQLSSPLQLLLRDAAEAVADKQAPNKPLSAIELVGKDFDSNTFASIYERLHASSANYEVLGISKEQWLAEPALRLARALGADAQNWIETKRFKNQSSLFNTVAGEPGLNLGHLISTAEKIPLMSSAEHSQAQLVKTFVLESPSENAASLGTLSKLFKHDSEAATFLLEKDAATTRGALSVLKGLPELPAPLAVEYAPEPYIKQLAASLAWRKLSTQLTFEETRQFLTKDFESNSSEVKNKFQTHLENIEASGPRRLLQDAELTADVITELHPNVKGQQAEVIARVANSLSQRPFELIASGFEPELFLAARERLNENQSNIITMTSLWDKDTKAFQIVNAFGKDYKSFIDQVEEKLTSSHYSRDQFYTDLKLPMKSPEEMKPLADFLLRNSSMPISETHALLERLNQSSSENFKSILSSSDAEIQAAAKSWRLAPDLPFAIAAHFGDKKTIETTAAALTYFEQSEATPPALAAQIDALKIDSPHFEKFWQKYPETFAQGKHALIAEANSVRAAIGAYYPNLAERHRLALESAAMTTATPLQYVAQDTKAGVFGKVFDRLIASSDNKDGDWQARSALTTTNILGRNALHWLDKQEKRGFNLHDATRWLPMYSPKEASGLGEFLNANSQRKIRELRIVANRWPDIPEEIRKLPFRKMISKLRENAYENIQSPALAKEAFAWDVSAKDYARDEPRFLKSLDTPSPFPLSKTWSVDNLTGRFLPRSDPRGLYLGEHTNCCQHPGEAGATCAWFGQESARSGFFVVENTSKEIVAQSWAWISDKGGLVFDSLEAKGLKNRADAVSKIYQNAANDLSQEYSTVTLGQGTSRVDLSQWPGAGKDTQPLPQAYSNMYTDAHQQVLLAKNVETSGVNSNAMALSTAPLMSGNRTLLTSNGRQPLAVRLSDLSSDLDAAERVAKAVYPKGYRYVSDGDSLLVLDAAGHGTVGYASIDLGTREITDLAVLEKFRPHSRLLMKGVYDFLRSNQDQPGQIWNAELRQSTTDRLVNYYEQKGLLTLLARRQADTMHGEPMYSVRFTLP